MTEPMSPEAHLAGLLHQEIRDRGWPSCVHSPEDEWLPLCAEIAARLLAAGVTLDAEDSDHFPGCPACEHCACAGTTAVRSTR